MQCNILHITQNYIQQALELLLAVFICVIGKTVITLSLRAADELDEVDETDEGVGELRKACFADCDKEDETF